MRSSYKPEDVFIDKEKILAFSRKQFLSESNNAKISYGTSLLGNLTP